MSTLVALSAALLAFLAGLLSSEAPRFWRAAAAWAVALVAAGTWWASSPTTVAQDVDAVARSGAGPVEATVVLERPGAFRRQVRSLSLSKPVTGSGVALLLMLALGVVAALGQSGERPRKSLAAAAAVGAGVCAYLLQQGGGPAEGEAGMRAFLTQMSAAESHLTHFTVPPTRWAYEVAGALPVTLIAGVALISFLLAFLPKPLPLARLGGLAAAIAAGAPALRILEVGGLPWRPVEGALWLVAVLLAAAWWQRDSAVRQSSLVGAGLALAALCFHTGGF